MLLFEFYQNLDIEIFKCNNLLLKIYYVINHTNNVKVNQNFISYNGYIKTN